MLGYKQVPRQTCPNGLTVSVQASKYHYCTPRNNVGPYSHVELGFPSDIPPAEILYYAEDQSSPCETVYGYVPVGLVINWLIANGGKLEGFQL